MKTSTFCTSDKVRLQTEMQYSFPNAISLQSTFCFSCPPGSERTFTRLLVTRNPPKLSWDIFSKQDFRSFWFISIQGHNGHPQKKMYSQAHSLTSPPVMGKATRDGAPQVWSRIRGLAACFLLCPPVFRDYSSSEM